MMGNETLPSEPDAPAVVKYHGRKVKALSTRFAFLDRLRDSGATNMYGAGPYVMQTFDVSRDEASKIVAAWMRTYDGKSSAEDRARAAIAKAAGDA